MQRLKRTQSAKKSAGQQLAQSCWVLSTDTVDIVVCNGFYQWHMTEGFSCPWCTRLNIAARLLMARCSCVHTSLKRGFSAAWFSDTSWISVYTPLLCDSCCNYFTKPPSYSSHWSPALPAPLYIPPGHLITVLSTLLRPLVPCVS